MSRLPALGLDRFRTGSLPHVSSPSLRLIGQYRSQPKTLTRNMSSRAEIGTVRCHCSRPFGLTQHASVPKSIRRRRRAHYSPTSTGPLGIGRIQYLAASFRQRQELGRKPYDPIGMGLLYLTKIAATNFLHRGIRRHCKNAPPLVLFGLPGLFGGPLTLPLPPYLGLPLLFGSSAGILAAASRVQVPCVASLG